MLLAALTVAHSIHVAIIRHMEGVGIWNMQSHVSMKIPSWLSYCEG